jgi:hypothetical protein
LLLLLLPMLMGTNSNVMLTTGQNKFRMWMLMMKLLH